MFLRVASSWVWGQRVHRGGAHWPCSLGGILNGSLWGKEHCRGGLHTRYGVHGKTNVCCKQSRILHTSALEAVLSKLDLLVTLQISE